MSLRLRDDRKHEGKGAAAASPSSHGSLHSGAIGVYCRQQQQQQQQQQDKILELQKELETERRNRAAHEAVVEELSELRRDMKRLQSENEALQRRIDSLQRGVAPTAPKAVVPAPKAVAPAPAPPKPSVKDKERKELEDRIEEEKWWLGYKAPKRDESKLLTLLLDRLQQLDTTADDKYEESDDNAKLQKLGADASAKAKELFKSWKLELQRIFYLFGGRQGDPEGPNLIRFEEYKAKRPYLYVLYGGELPVPNPL
jgi:hypothetical protein